MKSILFSILFLFVPKLCISQVTANDKTIYLDSLWQKTTQGNHQYYRVVKDYYSDLKEYKIYEYYKNDTLKTAATMTGKDSGSYNGEKKTYYKNGNKQDITYYNNGRPIGKYLSYYENGNKKEEGEYIDNHEIPSKHYKLNQYWDENNNHLIIDGNGNYSCGNKIDYIETGIYKDGYKDGIYEGKNIKNNTSFIEKYKDGKFISGVSTTADGKTDKYSELEKKPEPKRGMEDFYNFISKNYKIPVSMPKGIKGKVYLTFIVDKDGTLVEPKIIRDLGYGTGAEAIRVVMAYDGFIPGEQRGQKVRCSYALPLTIQNPY